MTDHSNIDERFRQSRSDWEGQPSDAAWDRLQDRLEEFDAGRGSKRKTIFRLAAAASLTILLGLSFAMFNQSMDVAGFHAVNTDQEIPQHEGVFAPISTSEFEEGPAMTKTSMSPEEVVDEIKYRTESVRQSTPSLKKSDRSTEKSEFTDQVNESVAEEVTVAREAFAGQPDDDNSGGYFQDAAVEEHEQLDGAEMDMKASSYSEMEEATEPEALTEATVANAIGIEEQKAKHQKRFRAKMAPSQDMKTIQSYENAGDRAGGFVTRSLIVLIPNEDKTRCTYTAFLVEDNRFYIDRCQTDAFDLILDESLPLEQSVLLELLKADVEQMQQIEKENRDHQCSDDMADLQLVYRYGTDLSYFDEVVKWSADGECLSPEARDILVRLKAFLKALD